ncbi:MAG TPA: amino acid ABC transporter substrate-binding protein [Myxococcales bacterium]|nr:amino acid ABC transporter substrate-binding protein [Myxococcales bacterium]
MRLSTRVCGLFLLLLTDCATPQAGTSLPTDTLSRIKQTKIVRLGYRDSSIPFSFVGSDGKPAGYSVDLCTRVVEGLANDLAISNLRTEWVKVTVDDRIDALTNFAIDLECGSTTSTLSRQERVDFSNLTFVDGATFLGRADAGLRSIGDLSGKRIAVIPGTTTERLVREVISKAKVNAEIVEVKEHAEGLGAVNQARADAYASDRAILLGLALTSGNPNRYTMVDRYLSYEPYALMLRRDAAFRLAVNRQLARIYRSGVVLEVYRKWFGELGPPSDLLMALYALYALPE